MEKVLLVEDEFSYITTYTNSLTNSNFEVISIREGSEIENIVAQQKIDIILSDTKLIGQDGDEICRNLLRQGKLNNILIIGMSSSISNEKHWKSVAHEFFYKKGIINIGNSVRKSYNLYLQNPNMKRYKEF